MSQNEKDVDKNVDNAVESTLINSDENEGYFKDLNNKKTYKGGMEMNAQDALTKREEDYSKWYLDVIEAADLADNSPVRGCMVIKPNGYALWENIQKVLDAMFKKTGVKNAYFPLLIPMSFLTKEAEHVDGFATECAVVTHHRLEKDADGKMVPAGELDEPLIIRPTSETIMYHMYSQWINSWRDLPLLLNQWCNVIRWEKRTRPFLRTTEFLWQEGHTAHATKEEAEAETSQMLKVYQNFAENYLALPVMPGRKTESEKFAGADYTTTIEAMMQDGKALQSGTSHMLGQNFAKAFEVKFTSKEGVEEYVWQTSWGLSTRIIGALIMAHSDDKGLVLPPKIAPTQVAIVPIAKNDAEKALVYAKCQEIAEKLEAVGITVESDLRDDVKPGMKFYKTEKQGIPVRLEIGPRDVAAGTVVAARRDSGEKQSLSEVDLTASITKLLVDIQDSLYVKALKFRNENTHEVNSWDEFKEIIETKRGFLMSHWCGDAECEAKIKEETKATSRCIPFDQPDEDGKCVYCGKPSGKRIIFARAY